MTKLWTDAHLRGEAFGQRFEARAQLERVALAASVAEQLIQLSLARTHYEPERAFLASWGATLDPLFKELIRRSQGRRRMLQNRLARFHKTGPDREEFEWGDDFGVAATACALQAVLDPASQAATSAIARYLDEHEEARDPGGPLRVSTDEDLDKWARIMMRRLGELEAALEVFDRRGVTAGSIEEVRDVLRAGEARR